MQKPKALLIFSFLVFLVQWLVVMSTPSPGVQLRIHKKTVVMDNGILEVTISNPQGYVTGIRYNGMDNLLASGLEEDNRGYWDHDWNNDPEVDIGGHDRITSTNFSVIVQNEEQIELSFTRTWEPSQDKAIPLNIDKRFVMLRDSSGFYAYAIHDHLEGWPAFDYSNVRMVFKLNEDKFRYMAIADNRQREMPLPEDRERGQPLAYKEAVLLNNPKNKKFKGEVDDKYQYSSEAKDIRVHGWISKTPAVGFWLIMPTDESRSFGPVKQFLTSHVGPASMTTYHSSHYVGPKYGIKIEEGEPWKKVFSPSFVYVNSLPSNSTDRKQLWEDAKNQSIKEVQSWPYCFLASEDFVPSYQRGSVSGKLLVQDRYVSIESIPAKGAYVGLAAPGDLGSWQTESKGYQFWTVTNADGSFSIKNVLTGSYNLYAWVPGFIGDYKYDIAINITTGSAAQIGDLVYNPPRDGPTLFEIGIPDRSAAEFYVPDPNPKYINKLYVNHTERFRQYGLWERYSELYPDEDLVYTAGFSDYKKDWYFAQNTRNIGDTYQGTTWQIKFKLDSVDYEANYMLRLALAAANGAELQVRVNDALAPRPLFTSGLLGLENMIARHGIQGLYRQYNVTVPGARLMRGDNTIFLRQSRNGNPFTGIMYDYIRLEGPST